MYDDVQVEWRDMLEAKGVLEPYQGLPDEGVSPGNNEGERCHSYLSIIYLSDTPPPPLLLSSWS